VSLILGVDTSCDDTGVGLVRREGGAVVANQVASQTAVHAPFGGVVPERASREHLAVIDGVAHAALREADATLDDVSAVAATYGPGLVGALLVGLTWAKALAWSRELPFLPVHHLEGHLASAGAARERELCLVASGGHTSLFRVERNGRPHELGRSRDDAAGEAFDKVARLLGLPFPGGPALSELAREGDPDAVDLPTPMRGRAGYDFSFSGLKTAVAVLLERHPDVRAADVAASFERAVVDALLSTLTRAARDEGIATVSVVGGVAANRRLRQALAASGLSVRVPPASLTTDNGAMIALAARARLARGATEPDWTRDAAPYLPLEDALA
jgi:N6-L-threonylcarbamoyladenine synthase